MILCSIFKFLFEFQVVRTSNRSKFEGPLYIVNAVYTCNSPYLNILCSHHTHEARKKMAFINWVSISHCPIVSGFLRTILMV
jgi:hypothetical protein